MHDFRQAVELTYMEYPQEPRTEGPPTEEEVDAMSDRVDEINKEIWSLENERMYLSDPADTVRIDYINQRIPLLEDERTILFRKGAQ